MVQLTQQLGYTVTLSELKGNLETLLAAGNNLVEVAVLDQRIIGWLHVQQNISLESGNYCEITGLIVDAAHRSKGIGKVLVDHAKQWARERGFTKLRVRSNVKRQKAHEFYFREGFKEVKEQKSLEARL